MTRASAHEAVADVLRNINDAWLNGRPEDMQPLIHPEIALALPGFEGREHGAERYVAGHRDFYEQATMREFRRDGQQIDIVADTAIATYRYELIYELSGQRYRSLGRDLWVLRLYDGQWLAVWRTILDVEEDSL